MSAQDLALLRDIAAGPRPTGSEAIASARERCARDLRSLGYIVRERPFEFSSFVGRFSFTVFGTDAALLACTVWILAAMRLRFAPIIVGVVGIVVFLVAGRWFLRDAVLTAPLLRSKGVNLEACADGDTPTVWLCAHLDSKSQPLPTLVRTIGIVLEGAGVVATLGLAAATALGASNPDPAWAVAQVLTLAGAAIVVMCVVGTNSPGALDNASGVATVIAAAREMRGVRGVGVLITDAEELALAGARAWSAGTTRNAATVLNCDGIDDGGAMYVMHAGARPVAAFDAAERASRATGIAYRARRLGAVLSDSVAFADAGIPSLSFSRGSVRSLWRVHGPRDSLGHLTGAGIDEAARLIAATARELLRGKV